MIIRASSITLLHMKGFFTGFFIFLLFPCLVTLTGTLVINTTILDSDFMLTTLSSFDFSPLLEEVMKDQIKGDIPKEIMEELSIKIKGLLEKRLKSVIEAFYDYLLGKSGDIKVIISIKSLKEELKPMLLEFLLESQPKENHRYIKKEFDKYWKEFSSELPDNLDIGQLLKTNKAYETIENVKEVISIFRQIMNILIAVSIILGLLIILVQRNLKNLLIIFGVIFSLLGLLFIPAGLYSNYTGLFERFAHEINGNEIPQFAYIAAETFFKALAGKVQVFGISYLAAGASCIVGAVIVGRSEKEKSQKNG